MKAARDIYQEVTDRIIDQLEAGTVPWRQPWTSLGHDLPRNVRNAKRYRGINVFLLAITAMLNGYTDPRWGTYKALGEKGGQVRQGEKGTQVVFWKRIEPKEGARDENGDPKKPFMMLRYYTVFNVEQADGIEPLPVGAPLPEHERNAECESVIADYCGPNVRKISKGEFVAGPTLSFGGDSAHYVPATDHLQLPVLGQFDDADAYYATAYHEMTHSTGSDRRLKRGVSNGFGSDPYAREELVAELGAAMLNAITGIETRDESSASYVATWLGRLKDDRRLVVQAAAQAQKAVDLILDVTFDEPETEGAKSADKADLALAS
jgi:antirestriction protein ArdC